MLVASTELSFVESALAADRQLDAALEAADERGEPDEHIGESQVPTFFGRFPHLILALDFDEYVVLNKTESENTHPYWKSASAYGVDDTALVYSTESIYRSVRNGAWYILDGLTPAGQFSPHEALHFIGPGRTMAFPVDEWLMNLAKMVENGDPRPRALWLPGRWTPTFQQRQREALKDAVDPILGALTSGCMALHDLHWRELEEVVAELLAQRGLEIEVTPCSHDGGRDVVARGELIPGEPLQLAIEVKQKPVVGLADVQRALYANRKYPALMVATAGTFSAGVVQERIREENSMRLFLKDGTALQQWLGVRKSAFD
jgi:hypothetical protein